MPENEIPPAKRVDYYLLKDNPSNIFPISALSFPLLPVYEILEQKLYDTCIRIYNVLNFTVGRNEKKIAEYIQNQMQEDIANEQLTMKEYIDPFGEEGKK